MHSEDTSGRIETGRAPLPLHPLAPLTSFIENRWLWTAGRGDGSGRPGEGTVPAGPARGRFRRGRRRGVHQVTSSLRCVECSSRLRPLVIWLVRPWQMSDLALAPNGAGPLAGKNRDRACPTPLASPRPADFVHRKSLALDGGARGPFRQARRGDRSGRPGEGTVPAGPARGRFRQAGRGDRSGRPGEGTVPARPTARRSPGDQFSSVRRVLVSPAASRYLAR